MRKVVRVYGKTIRYWERKEEFRTVVDQREIAYEDFYFDNLTKRRGTEDYGEKRFKESLVWNQVWTWDGVSRNNGGYKKWEHQVNLGYNKYNTSRKDFMEYLKNRYPQAVEISLR